MPALRSSTGPWQAFACAVVGGAGVGAARTANQTLLITLVTPEQRAASFALGRVASSLGLGSGATVAGFIVASAQHLRSFQTLYLFDAMACAEAIAAGDPSYRTVRGILAAGAERDQLPAAAGDGGAAAFLRGPGIDQERRHACLDRPEVVRPVAVPGEHRVTRADPQRVPGAEPGEQPNQAWLVVDASAPAGEAGAGQGKTIGTVAAARPRRATTGVHQAWPACLLPAVCLVPAPPHRDASCHSLPPAHPGHRSPPCAQIQVLCARPVAPTARLTTTPSRRYAGI